jgi:ribosome-binding factor A
MKNAIFVKILAMDTKRQLQLGELIKRNFSVVLQESGRNVYGDILVSVTKAMISPDLSQAKIYLSVYGIEDKDSVIIKMEQHMYHLKSSLVHRIKKQTRRMPDLFFFLDDTVDEMYKIDELLKKIK